MWVNALPLLLPFAFPMLRLNPHLEVKDSLHQIAFLPCLRLTFLIVGGQITGLTERANEMLGGLGNVQSHFQCYYFNAIISFSDWVQILVLPFANAVTWAKLILK